MVSLSQLVLFIYNHILPPWWSSYRPVWCPPSKDCKFSTDCLITFQLLTLSLCFSLACCTVGFVVLWFRNYGFYGNRSLGKVAFGKVFSVASIPSQLVVTWVSLVFLGCVMCSTCGFKCFAATQLVSRCYLTVAL